MRIIKTDSRITKLANISKTINNEYEKILGCEYETKQDSPKIITKRITLIIQPKDD